MLTLSLFKEITHAKMGKSSDRGQECEMILSMQKTIFTNNLMDKLPRIHMLVVLDPEQGHAYLNYI